ncbi:MAG: hypothetical protein KAS46_05950 [Candidatus Aureabacteria bacterium]|nr:hypothetical protein [Candidatus Auribacterota bacterium]
MKKTLFTKIIAILITTFIFANLIYLINLTGGNLVRKKLLEDEQLVQVLDYIKESGVSIKHISIANKNAPKYPGFFLFMFLNVLLLLGIHSVSTKVTKKLFNIAQKNE